MPAHPIDRTELIVRLSEVFQREGYSGATLTQLARAAGMTKSSLYHHFPGGKREMAEALLRHAVSDLERHAFGRLSGHGRPAERLAEFLEGFATHVDQGNGHCLLAVLAQGAARAELGPAISAQVSDWLNLLATTLEESGVKPKRARRLAGDLIDQLYGSLTVSKMLTDPDHFARTCRRLARRLGKEV